MWVYVLDVSCANPFRNLCNKICWLCALHRKYSHRFYYYCATYRLFEARVWTVWNALQKFCCWRNDAYTALSHTQKQTHTINFHCYVCVWVSFWWRWRQRWNGGSDGDGRGGDNGTINLATSNAHINCKTLCNATKCAYNGPFLVPYLILCLPLLRGVRRLHFVHI